MTEYSKFYMNKNTYSVAGGKFWKSWVVLDKFSCCPPTCSQPDLKRNTAQGHQLKTGTNSWCRCTPKTLPWKCSRKNRWLCIQQYLRLFIQKFSELISFSLVKLIDVVIKQTFFLVFAQTFQHLPPVIFSQNTLRFLPVGVRIAYLQKQGEVVWKT